MALTVCVRCLCTCSAQGRGSCCGGCRGSESGSPGGPLPGGSGWAHGTEPQFHQPVGSSYVCSQRWPGSIALQEPSPPEGVLKRVQHCSPQPIPGPPCFPHSGVPQSVSSRRPQLTTSCDPPKYIPSPFCPPSSPEPGRARYPRSRLRQRGACPWPCRPAWLSTSGTQLLLGVL